MPRGIRFSLDLRQRIINAYRAGDRQIDIARRFDVKRKAVWANIKRYERTGSLELLIILGITSLIAKINLEIFISHAQKLKKRRK